jgi:hypothetical protein
MPPVLLPNVSGYWLAIGAVARMRPSPRVGSHVVSTTRPLPSSTSPKPFADLAANEESSHRCSVQVCHDLNLC